MKNLQYLVNVKNNSNKIYTLTSHDFGVSAKSGNLINFNNEPHNYTVDKTHRIFYIQDFIVESDKYITIKEDVGFNILKSDTITLSYKEYEMMAIMSIIEPGGRYKPGDKIFPEGGVLVKSIEHNLTQPAEFEVVEVNETGGVTVLGLKNIGLYLQTPSKICDTHCNRIGKGLKLELEFKIKSDRKIIEKEIAEIFTDHKETKIYLNYPLPNGILNGKLSLQKDQIILTEEYKGETKSNIPCSILRDFSSHLKLPLVNPQHFAIDKTLNHVIHQIDNHFKKTDEKILEVEKKHLILENPSLMLESRIKELEENNKEINEKLVILYWQFKTLEEKNKLLENPARKMLTMSEEVIE